MAVGQRHPAMIIGVSDGGAHLDRDDGSDWSTAFLAFWVRDRKLWTLEEGIRQMTQVPAALLGFEGRGMLLPGLRGRRLHLRPRHHRARVQEAGAATSPAARPATRPAHGASSGPSSTACPSCATARCSPRTCPARSCARGGLTEARGRKFRSAGSDVDVAGPGVTRVVGVDHPFEDAVVAGLLERPPRTVVGLLDRHAPSVRCRAYRSKVSAVNESTMTGPRPTPVSSADSDQVVDPRRALDPEGLAPRRVVVEAVALDEPDRVGPRAR